MNKLKLAQYLVNEFGGIGEGVTPLKLQKLLYYVKAWGVVAGSGLAPLAVFKKWTYGPVEEEVYHCFKEYGSSPIPYMESLGPPPPEKKKLIDFIGLCYAQFDAVTLSAMTHKEDPWINASPNGIISDQAMLSFYKTRKFAKNFPFHPTAKPFYPVESDSLYAFTMDMSDSEAESVSVYPSYVDYVAQLKSASGRFDDWFEKRLLS